jgi:pimeloyl-ACP methyl ester carboxylesterase
MSEYTVGKYSAKRFEDIGLLRQIDGPVLLAGHSYGGAVISNATTTAPNVAGLVSAIAAQSAQPRGELP